MAGQTWPLQEQSSVSEVNFNSGHRCRYSSDSLALPALPAALVRRFYSFLADGAGVVSKADCWAWWVAPLRINFPWWQADEVALVEAIATQVRELPNSSEAYAKLEAHLDRTRTNLIDCRTPCYAPPFPPSKSAWKVSY